MRILFIGFALPANEFDELLLTDVGMPTQTQRFGWAVVDAMRLSGLEVSVLSAAPAADFPHNSRIFFQGGPFIESGISGRTLSFVNLPGLKHITRYLSVQRAYEALREGRAFDAIIVHGVHSPFIWSALRIGHDEGLPVVAILTDPPSLRTRFDSWFSWCLKKVDLQLIQRGLHRVQGVVALTEALATDFAPRAACMVMEGIAGADVGTTLQPTGTNVPPVVIYAGGLSASYGVRDLIDAVRMSSGEWRLEVYGRGPMETEIRHAANESGGRIFFGGMLPPEELVARYVNAELLVNPRPTTEDFVRYSFPSKLLEYMGSGTPTLTTPLPGIPHEYGPYLYWTEGGPAGLAVSIDATLEQPLLERNRIGAEAKRFVLGHRGRASQGVRIAQFLNSITLPMVSRTAGVARFLMR